LKHYFTTANHFAMKTLLKLAALFAGLALVPDRGAAQMPAKLAFEIGIGLHSFYMPGIGARYENPKPTVHLGVYRALNPGRSLQAGITLGYQRNRLQGDGAFAQAQLRYNPVIGKHLEPGIALGAGYQMAFHPSSALRWEGGQWNSGARYKGVLQAPVRISLGYRSHPGTHGQFTPFVAYQTNVLFGYSPDLSPLPVSAFLAGLKFSPVK
jgi:hypothetical protein